MNRRAFLAATASGLLAPVPEPVRRYFFAPVGGWGPPQVDVVRFVAWFYADLDEKIRTAIEQSTPRLAGGCVVLPGAIERIEIIGTVSV